MEQQVGSIELEFVKGYFVHHVLIRKSFWIDQSHRYGRHQAACREPVGSYDKITRTAICFEHKTQYIFIRAPYTRIVEFGTSVTYPPWFRRVRVVVIRPRFI